MKQLLKCPTCNKSGDWLGVPAAPFCSKRCKLIDLGKWFSEENMISDPLRPEHFQNYEIPLGVNPDEPEVN